MRAILAAGLLCAILSVVVTALVFSDTTQGWDESLALAVNGAYLGAAFNQLMVLATDYGREYFWVAIVALMLLVGRARTKVLALELAVLFLVGIFVGEAYKLVLFRDRPFETLTGIVLRVAQDPDSSFPSGHALIVSLGATFAVVSFRRRLIAGFLTAEAAVVCYSRVYLGAHYPMDVIGGVLVGASIALVGYYVLERYSSRILVKVERLLTRVLGNGMTDL
jgi:undecaprenyl-diphosphatase